MATTKTIGELSQKEFEAFVDKTMGETMGKQLEAVMQKAKELKDKQTNQFESSLTRALLQNKPEVKYYTPKQLNNDGEKFFRQFSSIPEFDNFVKTLDKEDKDFLHVYIHNSGIKNSIQLEDNNPLVITANPYGGNSILDLADGIDGDDYRVPIHEEESNFVKGLKIGGGVVVAGGVAYAAWKLVEFIADNA